MTSPSEITLYLQKTYGALMTCDDITKELGFCRGTIYNKLANGTFPIAPVRISRKVRFASNDVGDYLENQRAASGSRRVRRVTA